MGGPLARACFLVCRALHDPSQIASEESSSRAFGGGGTQDARVDDDAAVRETGAGVRDLRSVTEDLRDVVVKARSEQKATDAEGPQRFRRTSRSRPR